VDPTMCGQTDGGRQFGNNKVVLGVLISLPGK
jgi:hypothetical protein